jgi:hypothetical protein
MLVCQSRTVLGSFLWELNKVGMQSRIQEGNTRLYIDEATRVTRVPPHSASSTGQPSAALEGLWNRNQLEFAQSVARSQALCALRHTYA